MFHEPLHIRIADDPVGAFNALCYTIQVADFYNAIQILSTPTENLLNQLIPALGEYFTPALPALLNTSLKLELGWLFKDVICRLAGDHTRDDYQIRQGLDPVMASLVLQKRTSLRQMMKDVNYTLLTFKSLKYTKEKDAVATTAASACFREFIAFKVLDTDTRPWNEYAIIYRWLASTVETFDPFGLFRNYIFPKVASTKHAYDLFYSLHQDAARSIQPLLENCLSGPSPTEPNSDDQGFTCVRVDDGDLPWNKP
ncbi:MAG: hypothetical protein LQ338_000904 [Usnochroma carphineum]|nr:MAG: hypothetical protein LQ338_000904 [Usnochroma carphineum]